MKHLGGLGLVLFALACGSPGQSGSTPSPSVAPTAGHLLAASGAVARQKQYSFVAPQRSWIIDWTYTCDAAAVADPTVLCDLIVAVYGSDGKLVDELTPSPVTREATKSGRQVEQLGAGTFYLYVDTTGTTNWKILVSSGT